MSQENQECYSVLEVAEILGVSKKTVYRYIAKMLNKGVKGLVSGVNDERTKYGTKTFINNAGLAYMLKLSNQPAGYVRSEIVKGSLPADSISEDKQKAEPAQEPLPEPEPLPESVPDSDLIEFLKEQIKIKDDLIKSLTEQNYNNQCLLMNLQNQLLLNQDNSAVVSESESESESESVPDSVPIKKHWWNRRKE